MRRAIATAVLLLAGCVPLPTGGPPQSVTLRNDATVPVRMLVGRFVPGSAAVDPERALADATINARGEGSIELAPGRYTVEATAQSSEREVAVTQVEIKSGEPKLLVVIERFEQRKGIKADDPIVNVRVIGWSE